MSGWREHNTIARHAIRNVRRAKRQHVKNLAAALGLSVRALQTLGRLDMQRRAREADPITLRYRSVNAQRWPLRKVA